MKNPFTKRALFALLVTFLATNLFASETRIATMGGSGIFLEDQANVFLFPATLADYQDLVVAEMRARKTQPSYSVGVHMGYDQNTASALYINMPITSPLVAIGEASIAGLTSTLDNTYALMYAANFGGMNLGFGFMGAMSGTETGSGAGKVEETSRYLSVLAGLSNNMMDLGLMVELPAIERKVGDATTEFSGFGLNANGRMHLMKRNGYNIFPVGRVVFSSSSLSNGTEVDFGNLSVSGGVGVSKEINESNLIVVGIEGITYSSLTTDTKDVGETTTTTLRLPAIFVGVESRISSWLTGRVGAAQENVQTTIEETPDGGETSESTTDGSQFRLSLGLAMNFGAFDLDFAFNEGILFDGPAIISNTGEVLATQLSLTYNFGGEE